MPAAVAAAEPGPPRLPRPGCAPTPRAAPTGGILRLRAACGVAPLRMTRAANASRRRRLQSRGPRASPDPDAPPAPRAAPTGGILRLRAACGAAPLRMTRAAGAACGAAPLRMTGAAGAACGAAPLRMTGAAGAACGVAPLKTTRHLRLRRLRPGRQMPAGRSIDQPRARSRRSFSRRFYGRSASSLQKAEFCIHQASFYGRFKSKCPPANWQKPRSRISGRRS